MASRAAVPKIFIVFRVRVIAALKKNEPFHKRGISCREEVKGFVVDAARTSRQSMIWMVAVSALAAAKSTTVLIKESIKAVQNGTRLANETTVLIGRLTKASLEQAKAIEQINIGIDHISAEVQNNSATSEESGAASEELSGQADRQISS